MVHAPEVYSLGYVPDTVVGSLTTPIPAAVFALTVTEYATLGLSPPITAGVLFTVTDD